MQFAHAGIATDDAAGLAAKYTALFDRPIVHEETIDGMAVVVLGLDGADLELLEPRDGGPIATYLDRKGPGIHHVAFATPDIGAALERAREQSIELVDDQPRPGARGHDVAFLHPDSTGGVLVEFVER
ncbi:MAG: methylmalonyl-CoA epimerase [halophilic archaeon J07HX5]|nr:MAG: methylmalonyl-CoA epimerase [halophilic archaeon J07HX5]